MSEAVTVPALRFSEFEGELQSTKLGELMKISSASRVLKDEWTEDGVPFFRSSDVVSIYKGTENKKAFISMSLFEELSRKSGRLVKDDLLVTGGGSIGIPYLVTSNDPLYSKDADLIWLKTGESTSGPFIYAFLGSQIFRKYLKSISHIGTISHYTIEQAKVTPINLPSLPEQKKIAAFLGVVDTKLAALRDRVALLERYKHGLMQALFSQSLRFTKPDGTAFPNWEEKRLGEVADIYQPQTISQSDLVAEGYTVYGANGVIGKYTNYNHEQEQVTVTCRGNTCGTVGFTKPFSWITGNAMVINLDQSVYALKRFIYFLLSNTDWTYLITGSGQPQITGEIKKHKFLLPHPDEQQKIAEALSAMDAKIAAVSDQVAQMEQFKKGLLQQMFV